MIFESRVIERDTYNTEMIMSNSRDAIYLNNAAGSWPPAPGVVEAVTTALEEQPEHPGRSISPSADVATGCRSKLAYLLGGVDPTRIALTSSATQALNIALLGVGLAGGDHVITTVTEHNSVLRPLHHLEKERNIRLSIIGMDSLGAVDRDSFGTALMDKPALVVMNHASNVTGRINDVASYFIRAREAGALTLLDASQTFGAANVSPKELNADIVAFTGHKGLHGPLGTGGLFISEDLELDQIFVGGTGIRSDLLMHPGEMPLRLEAGTPNTPAIAGLSAALGWVLECGEEFRSRAQKHAEALREGLGKIRGINIFDDREGAERTGVVSFRLDGWSVEETGVILLQSFNIVSRTGLHCAPLIHRAIGSWPEGTVRFSVSGFNTVAEVEAAVSAIEKIAK